MQQVTIYTDGACSGNPGPGGWGYQTDFAAVETIKSSGGAAKTTNNRMELMAAIKALEQVVSKKQPYAITVYSDSNYVVQGISSWIITWKRNGWRNSQKQPVKNEDLWKQLDEFKTQLESSGSTVTFCHVRGHSGDPGNDEADRLANEGMAAFT